MFNVQNVEKQRADPSLPQCYQSRPCKTDQLAGSVFKKLVANLRESLLDPFEFVYPMPPGSVIVSDVESGDQLAHTDTSTAPHVVPLSDRSKWDFHLSTLVALSPQYRLCIQVGTALGEVEVERWEEALLNQGEVLVMVRTARHHGLLTPAGQDMQGALFMQWTPDKKHVNVLPNTTHLDPPSDPLLKKILGTLDHQEVPTYGQLLLLGRGGVGGPYGAGRGGPSG